jgi:integrase/recombinase XerD
MSAAVLELAAEHPLAGQVRDFLADQQFAGKAAHTIRAYRGDLVQLAAHTDQDVTGVDADVLRSWAASIADLAQSTRARKQAAVVAVPESIPRPVDPARVDRVLAVIPKGNLRDRLLFESLDVLGIRIGEALGIYIEDLDLTPGNEHVLIHGKGGRIRILLLDDPQLVNLLRRFLRETGWTTGPLFRATRNWTGRPLTYSTAQELWARYRMLAGEPDLELHQLRHTHATELLKDGVSVLTIRQRLGHRRLQTTMGYVEHSPEAVDAEMRQRQRTLARRGGRRRT